MPSVARFRTFQVVYKNLRCRWVMFIDSLSHDTTVSRTTTSNDTRPILPIPISLTGRPPFELAEILAKLRQTPLSRKLLLRKVAQELRSGKLLSRGMAEHTAHSILQLEISHRQYQKIG